jgi:hypothetical protein
MSVSPPASSRASGVDRRSVLTGRSPAGPTVPGPSRRSAAAADDLLGLARRGLTEAAATETAAERYAAAHLAALRAAAAVLAARARPDDAGGRRRGPRSVWALLPVVLPPLTEWAAFFAAGAGKRAAAEAGLVGAVTRRDADDLLRDAQTFLGLVEEFLGHVHQPLLPVCAVASG